MAHAGSSCCQASARLQPSSIWCPFCLRLLRLQYKQLCSVAPDDTAAFGQTTPVHRPRGPLNSQGHHVLVQQVPLEKAAGMAEFRKWRVEFEDAGSTAKQLPAPPGFDKAAGREVVSAISSHFAPGGSELCEYARSQWHILAACVVISATMPQATRSAGPRGGDANLAVVQQAKQRVSCDDFRAHAALNT